MTKESAAAFGLSIGLFGLVSVLPADGLAQTGNAAAGASATDARAGRTPKAGGAAAAGTGNLDMRLWSFGDCSKNFPYVETPEHKECIRVVGSDEAKDARAIYFCSVSHAKDPAEAARCKEAYFANKAEAEQEGFRARRSNPSLAAASAAAPAPKRDKDAEIAALTRALKALDPDEPAPGAAPAPEPAPAPARPPSSVSASNIMLGLAILLMLVAVGMRYLRKVAAADAAAAVPSRKGRSPRTVTGTATNQY